MARDVRVNILGDSRDFSRAVDSAERDASRLDGAFGRARSSASRMAGGIAIGAAGLAVAGGAMAMSFLQAAEEAQQVSRQTGAVIESMGADAWTSAGQVEELATSISNLTGIDDELIQMGQNRLLTFGNITENFDRTTQAMVDIAAARGEDMTSVAEAIGKALNDPATGLQRLTRMGIQFTDAQKDQIEAMVEVGDIAGAQTVMLEELERKYGGSAEAQATASQRLSTIWGNLQEQLGEYLLPLAEDFADWMAENLPEAIEKAKDMVGDLVDRGQDLVQWFKDHDEQVKIAAVSIGVVLVGAFVAWAVSAAAAAAATLLAIAPVILIGLAIAALVAGIIYAYQEWDWFRETVDKVWKFLKDSLWPAIQDGIEIVGENLVGAVQAAIDIWNALEPVVMTVANFIIEKVGAVVGAIGGIVGAIQSAIDKFRELAGLQGNMEKQTNSIYTPNSGRRTGGSGVLRNIPSHHSGGIYQAPNGAREGLAWLESGERVIPRGQSAGMGAAPMVVVLQVDGYELGRASVDGITSYGKSNTVTLPVRLASR